MQPVIPLPFPVIRTNRYYRIYLSLLCVTSGGLKAEKGRTMEAICLGLTVAQLRYNQAQE
jgi:hypothetical protein